MRVVPGFCIRKVLDETIAIPTQEAAHALSGLIAFNETGEFIFQLLQEEQSEKSLIEALLENYEVDEKTAEKDVKNVLAILRENHLLMD